MHVYIYKHTHTHIYIYICTYTYIILHIQKGITKISADTPQSAAGTTHSFSDEEKVAFVDWINHSLSFDEELKVYICNIIYSKKN